MENDPLTTRTVTRGKFANFDASGRSSRARTGSQRRKEPGDDPGIPALKIVFLDIDGVMNTLESCRKPGGCKSFAPAAVEGLKRILSVTGALIVVSSSWREDGMETIHSAFEQNGLLEAVGRIIGSTPVLQESAPHVRRADEIDAWLQGTKSFRYVILDDDDIPYPELKLRHIRTSLETGLTRTDADNAISMLATY